MKTITIDLTIRNATVEEAGVILAKLKNGDTISTHESKLEPISIAETPVQKTVTAATSEGLTSVPGSTVGHGDGGAATVAAAADDSGVDADNIPWDERIHSGNKKKKADGTWHARKGVDKELAAQIKQELLSDAAPSMPDVGVLSPVQVPTETPEIVTPPVTQAPPVAPSMPDVGVPSPVQVPTETPEIVTPPVTQAPPAAVPAQGGDFNALLTKIQQGMTAGTQDQVYIGTVIKRLNTQFNVQLGAITDIMTNQPMIDAAFAIMAEDGK